MRKKRPARLKRCILGIDVGGTNIRAGLYSPRSGSMTCVQATLTEAARGGPHALARVAALAGDVVEQGRAAGLSVFRVGIGIPELVGPAGQIESRCSLPWRAPAVRACLSAHGGVTIASDVFAAALAEARLGAGRDQKAFLYVTVGTGISCALVINGKVYSGPHGHALSFASGLTVAVSNAEGQIRYESLEGRVAGPGLLRRAQLLGSTAPDAVALCRAALEAPGIARDIVDSAATELAVHVAILANALDPTLVVLGGGLGCAPGRYWTAFRAALPCHTWGPHMRRLPVRQARLGTRAGLIGAALSALEA
jgi:glucokinase